MDASAELCVYCLGLQLTKDGAAQLRTIRWTLCYSHQPFCLAQNRVGEDIPPNLNVETRLLWREWRFGKQVRGFEPLAFIVEVAVKRLTMTCVKGVKFRSGKLGWLTQMP